MKLGLGLNLCVTLGLAEAVADLQRHMLLTVPRGKLVTPIATKFKLSEAAFAQQLTEASHESSARPVTGIAEEES